MVKYYLRKVYCYIQSESPSGSKLNALGHYILVCFLFVFGTMVEFAIVLIGKQKGDWDNKALKMKDMETKFVSTHSEKNCGCLTIIEKVEMIEDYCKVANFDEIITRGIF